MASDNPYAAPDADLEVDDPRFTELAGRWRRLGGSILDSLVLLIVIIPVLFMVGFWGGDRVMTELSSQEALISGLIGAAAYILINGYLLMTSGQSVGKKLLRMQIVSVKDEKILPIGKVLGLRFFPVWIVSQIQIAGPIFNLVNALFIFGEERRCLHDYIAGTKVIMYRG